MSIETAVTVNIISNFLVLVAYSYLFLQYRYRYLGKWLFAFILYLFRQLFLEKIFISQILSSGACLLYIFLTFLYSLLIIDGALEFAGKKLSKWWLIAGAVCIFVSGCAVFAKLPFEYYGVPAVLFVSSAYIGTGLVFWRIEINGAGKYITSFAFFMLGIHLLDMIFLFSVEWVVPWGFLIDGLIKILIAFGIIFVFFERNKNELEKYYKLLAENSTDVIYRYRFRGFKGFEYISPACKELTGHETHYFQTIREVINIIHPDDKKFVCNIIRGVILKNVYRPIRILKKNGDIVWVDHKFSLVYDDNNEKVAAEGLVRDVTSRVLLEQDVSRLDRLNIAGQMATSLAHEIRNPLSTVRGYIQLMGNRHEFENYKDRLTMMLDEIDRTNGIITEYLLLSKNKRADMKASNLNKIINSIHPLIEVDAAASNVEVVLALGDIPDLPLDDNEIKQMLLNFVRNGIEAMPQGGKLVIKTAAVGEEIILSISDQGKGIPQDVLDNMGKPFLTTKENGTGLGMAVCYRIASRHGAKIEFDTGIRGTNVNVRFKNYK